MIDRRVVLAVGVVVALSLAIGTGGFSASRADRTIDGQVATDEDAYLGITIESVTVTGNVSEGEVLATFSNNHKDGVEVSVVVSERSNDRPTLENVRQPGYLDPGEIGDLRADVRCGNSTATETVDLDVDASGEDLTVTAARTVTVACDSDTESTSTDTNTDTS